MMKIEKNETEINPKILRKHKTNLRSLQTTYRHREFIRIDQENQVFFNTSIHSSKCFPPPHYFSPSKKNIINFYIRIF